MDMTLIVGAICLAFLVGLLLPLVLILWTLIEIREVIVRSVTKLTMRIDNLHNVPILVRPINPKDTSFSSKDSTCKVPVNVK